MVITSVVAQSIRNHVLTRLNCVPGVNVLVGPNGAGKTTLLETISLCSLGRSFVDVPEQAMIRKGDKGMTARVEACKDNSVPVQVTIECVSGSRKKVKNTTGIQVAVRDMVGSLPIVALSPDHKVITFGAPAARRSFIDGMMAQADAGIKELLYEFRTILRQRNAALEAVRGSSVSEAALESWTESIIGAGARLRHHRMEFIAGLTPVVADFYSRISGGAETVSMFYETDDGVVTSPSDPATLASRLREQYSQNSPDEIRRGITLFGPQKDDIRFEISGRLVRETASQGQHKTLLVALKLGECVFLRNYSGEKPVVLLDDLFSELDNNRIAFVLHAVLETGMQCFVTTTNDNNIAAAIPPGIPLLQASLSNGVITSCSNSAAKQSSRIVAA